MPYLFYALCGSFQFPILAGLAQPAGWEGVVNRLPVLHHPKRLGCPELASIQEARTSLPEACDLLEEAGNRNPSD